MSSSWQTCPHCRVYFQPDASGKCPACHLALIGKPTEASWFYAQDRKKVGPVTWSAVKALATTGRLRQNCMILRAGTGRWVEAATIPGLFSAGGASKAVAVVEAVVVAGPPATAEAPDTEKPASWIKKKSAAPEQTAPQTPSAGSPQDTIVLPEGNRPSVLGYQILDELGRGGMGVVYKARQLRLNRIVALKMILAGAHAGSKDLERFRSEAEAVARLQHVNIVQIYEIAESEGRPYFSLEYVNGGSLTQMLQGTPQAPRQAARLVETLARAMHAAHQRGIIHRDLKPANVLLQMPSDGEAALHLAVPKITDFGLAKQLDSEQGQTRTGAVLGTPSYMAPEQAAGRNQQIGPVSDVYALGAILYEILTGRPPFRGETAMDTMFQVMSDEPVPPTRLQPKVPRDLETICLKCLQKEPGKRYRSAEALAEDLQLFLSGEPIQARPVGPAERTFKFMRRRPALAALLAVSACAVFTLVLGSTWYSARLRSAFNVADVQRQAAQQNAEEAQRQETLARVSFQKRIEEVDQLITRLDGRLAVTRGSETLRMEFLLEFSRSSEGILRENPSDPAARRQVAFVYRLLGDVWSQSFRDFKAADATYQKALAMQQQLVDQFPQEPRYRSELGETHTRRAQMLHDQRKFDPARAEYGEAISNLDELARLAPDAANQLAASRARYDLAGCLYDAGNKTESEKVLRQALAMQEKIVSQFPKDAAAHSAFGRSSESLAALVGGTSPSANNLRKKADRALDVARQLAPKAKQYRRKAEQLADGKEMQKRGAQTLFGRLEGNAMPVFAAKPMMAGLGVPNAPGQMEKNGADKAAQAAEAKGQNQAAAMVNEEAPDLEGDDLDGKPINLEDYRGKIVVVTFWANWNTFCRRQYEPQRQLVERMKNRPFAMFGVNCDETKELARSAAAAEKLNWRSVWDGRWGEITQEWKVQSYPMTYVIDARGVVRHRNLSGKDLDNAVEQLVKECEQQAKKIEKK